MSKLGRNIWYMKTVTIDTNVLPASSLVDLARNKGYEVAIVSVTEREVGQFDTRLHVQDLGTILETGPGVKASGSNFSGGIRLIWSPF